MFFSCVGVRLPTPCVFAGNLIQVTASSAYAQNFRLEGSVACRPAGRAGVVDATRGVVHERSDALARAVRRRVRAVVRLRRRNVESPGTVNDGPGNGAVSTGGISCVFVAVCDALYLSVMPVVGCAGAVPCVTSEPAIIQ